MDHAAIEASKARSAMKRERRERQRTLDREHKRHAVSLVQGLMAEQHVSFMHLRQLDGSLEFKPKGGTTVIYSRDGNTVRAAIAQCSTKDHYCKWLGRFVAAHAWREGNRICFNLRNGADLHRTLYRMFSVI